MTSAGVQSQSIVGPPLGSCLTKLDVTCPALWVWGAESSEQKAVKRWGWGMRWNDNSFFTINPLCCLRGRHGHSIVLRTVKLFFIIDIKKKKKNDVVLNMLTWKPVPDK